MKKQKKLTFVFVAICAVLMQLVYPAPVYADDGQPPAPPTDVTPVEPPADSSDNPVADPAPAEASPVAEVIAQLPPDSGLIVLDEQGEELPLASNAAAEALAGADPYFTGTGGFVFGFTSGATCPPIVTPGLCSSGLPRPIQAAVDNFQINGGTGAITVESGTYNENVTIDASLGTVSGLTGLIGFGSGTTILNGNLTISGLSDANGNSNFLLSGFTINGGVTIGNNNNAFTINGLDVTNTAGTGITVSGHSGNLTMGNITADGNSGLGVFATTNSGNVTLLGTNSFTSNVGGDGLKINAMNGDVNLAGNITSSGNKGGMNLLSGGDINSNTAILNVTNNSQYGALLYTLNPGGDVTLATGGDFSDNGTGTGLLISSFGEVTLTDVVSDQNGLGLYVDTLPGAGGVTINGTYNNFRNNYTGIYIQSAGNVLLSDVVAENNIANGITVKSDWGMVTLDNVTSSYNASGGGISVDTNSSVALVDITAEQNSYGVSVTAIGDVTLDGTNLFLQNAYTGLSIETASNITSTSNSEISASLNGGDGAIFNNASGFLPFPGDVLLDGVSEFSANVGDGLVVFSDGNVTLSNLIADGNFGNGALLVSNGSGNLASVTVNSAQLNGVYDVNAAYFCGGDVFLSGSIGSVVYAPPACSSYYEEEEVVAPASPEQFINADSGPEIAFDVDCSAKSVYVVKLPNGDEVRIFCPATGLAVIKRLDNTMLPADLPAGYSYASAFSLEIKQPELGSIPYIKEGGHITMSFNMPVVKPGVNYAVLYWDNGQWREVQNFMFDSTGQPRVFNLDSDRHVISGVNFVVTDVLASLNFLGVFVLVQY